MKTKNPFLNRKVISVFLFLITIVLFGLFLGRISYIMVKGEIAGKDLIQNVNKLYTKSSVLQAKRGTIYDRNGNPIAMDASSYKIFAVLTDEWSENSKVPQHIMDKQESARILAQYLSLTEEEIASRLQTKNVVQVEFGSAGNNLSYDTMSQIEEEQLPGIFFEEKQTRLYPNGTFASHLVGLAQTNQEKQGLEGVMGLEKAFEDVLAGNDGSVNYQKDRFGYALPNGEMNITEAKDGNDIYLTLDKRLQVLLENEMTKVNEENSPEIMTATLMDAKTGAILAASQRPTFNATTKEGIAQTWQNFLTEYAFEPGSTLKVVTLAAAIEEGVFNPNEYFESGSIEIEGGGLVRDVKRGGWGTITYSEGLQRSSNVAFVNLVEKMGYDTWKEYLDAFGFTQEVGMEVPEITGSNPYTWPLEKASTVFGQGFTVSVVQMLQAFSAITNEGTLVKPHIVDKIDGSQTGTNEEADPSPVESPISAETAKTTLEYLKEVVYGENGTAKKYQIEGFEIAAKTGTAQLVNPETKKYYSSGSNYIYSVVGMAPAENPSVILYVTVQQPTLKSTEYHGSDVVQKIFNPVMKRALEYIYQDKDSDKQLSEINMPKLTDFLVEDMEKQLSTFENEYVIIGDGTKIVQQYPLPDDKIDKNQTMFLLTDGAMTMPDLHGWSKNDVLKVQEITGVPFAIDGEGFVQTQSVQPGSHIQIGDKIEISLKNEDGE
ncbi:penicillin-binding transpeptidase domain-containing protein [Lacticigenium naphthae]|uniref:penicillin-binding transpeptidase domain-containing protein n=1 Tax=Lacticigenium naphthae TaxID=515351 RepID=UPI0003FDD27A|nr:penicillin-binding transpeptidase domain-containing protein [Lacticigenium naphthae]